MSLYLASPIHVASRDNDESIDEEILEAVDRLNIYLTNRDLRLKTMKEEMVRLISRIKDVSEN